MRRLKFTRIISVLLVLILCLGMMPVTGLAADKTEKTDTAEKAKFTDNIAATNLDNFKKVNSYTDGTFTDVKSGNWFYENVKTVYELGLMVGKGANKFDYASGVTIAETLAIAARLNSVYHIGKADFEQTSPWYQVYADYVTEKGIADISGLDMNAPATRAQFVHIIANALPDEVWESINKVADDAIPDVKISDSFGNAVYKLYRAGILTGNDSKGTFAPESNIKRSEVAAIITRIVVPSLRKEIKLGKEYTVSFDLNYGGKKLDPQIVFEGEKAKAPSIPARYGYNFIGWYTAPYGGYKFDFDTKITKDITLYAQWSTTSGSSQPPAAMYTVTFNTDGGSPVTSQQVAHGARAVEPAEPAKSGYTFNGWYTDPECNNRFDFNTPITGNITLYAGWITGPVDGEASGSYSSVDVYSITDLEVDPATGNVAATVSAPENCALVVRFIEENTYFSSDYPANKSYINNGDTYASRVVPAGSDMETITCTVNNSLPEYFVAEAILIDADGNPLCDPYTSIVNTQRYKQFKTKTVNDFDANDTVLSFERNNPTDNFGVLADDVKVLIADKVVFDYDNGTYYIENPSESIAVNDKIFIRDTQGAYLFKVGTITETGNGIIITPVKADDEENGFELKDFYKFMKVDMDYNGDLVPTDENEQQAGTDSSVYAVSGSEGEVLCSDSMMLMSLDVVDVDTSAETPQLSINPVTFETTHFKATAKVSGKLSANLVMEWDLILFGEDYFRCDFTYSTDLKANASVTGKWGTENNEELKKQLKNLKEERELQLGKVKIPFSVTGLSAFADIRLLIEWKLTAGIEVSGNIKTTSGFKYNTRDGYQKVDKKQSTWSVQAKGHAEVSFGPKPSVGIDFLNGVVSVNLECFMGAKIEADAITPVAQGGDVIHACYLCVDGNLKFVLKVDAKLKYKVTNHLKGTPIDLNLVKLEKPVFDFYVSLHNASDSMFGGRIQCGTGSCPNKEYRVKFYAKDADGHDVQVNIDVVNTDKNVHRATVQSGGSEYLPPANYVAKAVINGENCEKDFSVSSAAKTVTLSATAAETRIEGSVVDASTRQPIAGTRITVYENGTAVASAVTDASGKYSVSVDQGTYKLTFSADSYVQAEQDVTVRHGETKYLNQMLLAESQADRIMGGIYGTIKDAVTGLPLAGVTVALNKGWDNEDNAGSPVVTLTTDGNGIYSYRKWSRYGVDFGLDAGNYTVTISKDGYITTRFNVTIVGGADMEFNSTITPVGAENVWKIVLTWGAAPSDLDSHLNGVFNGERDHIYYSRKEGYGANLDVDDTTSYGPETITIPDASLYTGEIKYSVHDYSNRSSASSTALSNSGATIKVYKGGTLLETFNVPTDYTGTVWNVFYIDSDGNIIPVNTFESVSTPGDVTGSTGSN